MSFDRVPDRMVGFATYELAQLLAKLTAPQRAAIDRIVEHVYIRGGAWGDLFRDLPAIDISAEHPLGRPAIPRICADTSYYRRGTVDPETGRRGRPGWGHDEDFQAALKMAAELALAAQSRERQAQLQRAKRLAESNAADAVQAYIDVMSDGRVEFARIEAATKLLELAFRGEGDRDQSAGRGDANDWWKAAEMGASDD